jgi:uncharacterized protein with von Willebrand factor type A (vWA) domain
MSSLIRYSRWDGSQAGPDVAAAEVLHQLTDDVLTHGDPWQALRRLLQQGWQPPGGRPRPGLGDLLRRLRERRQAQLDRYDLDSTLEDIARTLDEIIGTERAGIERRVAEARDGARRGTVPADLAHRFERAAARNLQRLEALPPDPAGRIRELQRYDFVDPEARRRFDALLESLRQHVLQPFLQGMAQTLRGLTPDDLRQLRELLRDLNRLLRQHAEGGPADFEAFRQRWGTHFPGVESLEELLDHLGRHLARTQSLLESLSAEQRRQLDELLRSLFLRDERLEAQLRQLAATLSDLLPLEELSRRYPFRGEAELSLGEALRVLDELHELDRLERELQGLRRLDDLDRLDPARVARVLGEEAARDLEALRELVRKLEAAGYLEREGDALRLTARAVRAIADRALRDIFARLRRARFGDHPVSSRGAGGDQTDEAKRYEFGDPFLVDLKATVMNALARQGPGVPVRLAPEDFEVHRTELRTQAATVLLLDMSRSMLTHGYFVPAKKMALALGALLRGQFPRDALYVVGFSLYARRFRLEHLPTLSWSEWSIGTNIQAALLLARQLLARHPHGTRQIVLVTDGEPTAHLEGGLADFAYPPTRRTVEETLKEVQRCTRAGITINTFMLERSRWLVAFVEEMTRLNRGRAFFATPERLGDYVVLDYVTSRRRVLR